MDAIWQTKTITYASVGKVQSNKFDTGKSLSEALIFASTNPQYDNRLFIELQVHENSIQTQTWGEHVVYRDCF
jgi:hypothetical protein